MIQGRWNVQESPAWDGMDRGIELMLSHIFEKYKDAPDGHTRYLMNVAREAEEMFDVSNALIRAHAVAVLVGV